MSDKMKVRDGKDGYSYPYTSTDLVIDNNGKSNTTKFNEIDAQFKDIANQGTTVEVLERVTKEEIDRQIKDGTIANLTIQDFSLTKQKVKGDGGILTTDNCVNSGVYGLYCDYEFSDKTITATEISLSLVLPIRTGDYKYRVSFDFENTLQDDNISDVSARLFFNNSDDVETVVPSTPDFVFGNPINLVNNKCHYEFEFKSKTLDNTHPKITVTVTRLDLKPIKFNVSNLTIFENDINVDNEVMKIGSFTKGGKCNYTNKSIENSKHIVTVEYLNSILDKNKSISYWSGKKWLAFGDSITYGYNADKSYVKFISERIGCNGINCGISGEGYATTYSGAKMLYQRIDENNATEVDLVTLFCGTNDWNNLGTVPLGVKGDSTSNTFYGCVKLAFDKVIEKFPLATIIVITPLPRTNDMNLNRRGEKLIQYVDAIIDMSEDYSFPILDLYRKSNFHRYNTTFKNLYMPDELHPSTAGQELLSKKILAFLDSIMK